MSDRVWLASYPGSGNTWLRILIGAMSLDEGAPLDINRLPKDGGIASGRSPFDQSTLIDSGLLTHDEVDSLRPCVYEYLAREQRPATPDRTGNSRQVTFVKVHDAYTLTPLGAPLLGGSRGAKAALLILRDPRDVATSLANHNRSTIDEAIEYMNDPSVALCERVDRRYEQFRQKLMSWHSHSASWLDQRDIPVHVVRYEDMKRDAVGTILAAMDFAGWKVVKGTAERAVALARFDNLQAQENVAGFSEWHDPGGRKFFRRGEAGTWRDALTREQVQRIEAAHAPMMARLGYALSADGDAVREETEDQS